MPDYKPSYVQCPFCGLVWPDDGPPVLCCGEIKCMPCDPPKDDDRFTEEAWWREVGSTGVPPWEGRPQP